MKNKKFKKGDKCYILVTCDGVNYNGYPVCKIKEDEIISSGEKYTLTSWKDYFNSKKERYPQFFTNTGERNWTPKNLHDFDYHFYLITENDYLKNINGNLFTFRNQQFIIR